MKKSIQTHSAAETKRIAKELAKTILKSPQRRGALVLALKGELGTGKTSFVQGLARDIGVKGNVLSPTFLIVKNYQIPKSLPCRQAGVFQNLYHVDCYRIENAKELLQLGWREIIKNPQNIVAVEWADRIKPIIPKDALWIHFSYIKEGLTRRSIMIK